MSHTEKYVGYLIPPTLVALLVFTIAELFYGWQSVLIEVFDAFVIILFAVDLYYRWKTLPVLGPYVKKYWLDIIATIPFGLIFWGIEGLALLQGLRGIRILSEWIKLMRVARAGKGIRLLRFAARSPRFLRARKHIKKGKIRKVAPHEKTLSKKLSFRVILLITINSIMGTGIWFLTSAGAKYAGPASLVSWVVLSFIAVYISMCFSELVAMFPKAGGVYEFAKQTYGRFWSFVIGWTTAIAGSVTIAMLLLGALQYLIPLEYSAWYVPVAIGLILLFSAIAYRGMQTSKVALVTFALITLAAVVAIIVPGFFSLNPGNFDPFFVFESMAIALTIFFIAETFFGWESAIFLSAETKNPTKVMPRALIGGTIIIAILAFLLAFTAMGTIPWSEYASSAAPLKDLGVAHFGETGGLIFAILIFISVIGATAGWVVTAPRLLMAIAEDKLFFVQFAKVHPKHKSPYVSIFFQAAVVSVLVWVGAGSYETLLHMLIPLILIMYSAVMLAVLVLRVKRPDLPRPYKAPFGKIGPLLTVIFMVFLLVMFIKETHGALAILRISGGLILFGVPAYLAIELFYDQKYVVLRRRVFAGIKHQLGRVPRPRPYMRAILKRVGGVEGKRIVVSGSAGLARYVMRKVKLKKMHVLVPIAEEVTHLRKKSGKGVDYHIIAEGGIPKDVKGLDAFISVDDLGYVKSMDLFVKKIAGSLKKKGTFCLFVMRNLVSVAPNSVEIDDREELKKIFMKHGLRMMYTKRHLGVREDVYIYGWKK